MGCSSSKINEKANLRKNSNIEKVIILKENKEEPILISQKIQNGKEIKEKIIKIGQENLLINDKEKLELKENIIIINANKNINNINPNNLNLKISNNLDVIEKKESSVNNINKNINQNPIHNCSNKNSKSENKNIISINPISNKDKNEKYIIINKKESDSLNINSNKNVNILGEQEIDKPFFLINVEKQKDKDNIIIPSSIQNNAKQNILNNINDAPNESVLSKLSSNMINTRNQNLKDTNIAKDEKELLLNLTKTQNLTHFQDDNHTKNILNSIDKDDNLLIKFNTGVAANSILNNTNFKINESQSQQNISNIHKSSILDENKSVQI